MIYGNVQLSYRPGSLVIVPTKHQEERHYLGTDVSDVADLGRSATRIMCTLIARTEKRRAQLEQILHGVQEDTLTIGVRYYKRVVTGGEPQLREAGPNAWEVSAEFLALDPIPYSAITDKPLY